MERPVSANVRQVTDVQFVADCDIDNQVAVTAEVDGLGAPRGVDPGLPADGASMPFSRSHGLSADAV
jgi:hypothetical protein